MGQSRNVNRNISRARDDTHIFLEDPWSHRPTGQRKLNRKAQIALGETELAHRRPNSSKSMDFFGPQKNSSYKLLSSLLQFVVALVYKLQHPEGLDKMFKKAELPYC